MVLMNIAMHFGRTVAHIAHDVWRPYILTGRDAHIFASIMQGQSDQNSEIPYLSKASTGKMQRRPVCCFKTLQSKLDEKSIVAVVLPVSSDSPALESSGIINLLAVVGTCRLGSKGLLNATTAINPTPSKRGICTLVHPIELKSLKIHPSAYVISTQPVRFVRRKNCAEWCGTDPCDIMRKATVQRPSMWLDPHCFNKLVCPHILRHDIVHMPGSDKATREYQQTWIECPPRIVPKLVCCPEPLEMPPICKRPRKVRPPTATYCQTQNTCKTKDICCPKAEQLPCCDKARQNPCCIIYPSPSCCQKRCTPFPSYSECCREDISPKHPTECFCLARPTMCEVWADWRKKYAGTRFRPFRFAPNPQ